MKYRRLSWLNCRRRYFIPSSSNCRFVEVHATRILIPHHTTTIAEIKLAAVKAISNK
jgi:hypothetical protein